MTLWIDLGLPRLFFQKALSIQNVSLTPYE